MAGLKVFTFLLLLLLLICTTSAGKGRKKRDRRCKYDKRGAVWSQCDQTLQVKTKVATLVRGRSRCPKTRTYTKPCDDGSILLNGCKYIQVSDWSECDPVTLTSTRTLELSSGDTKVCDNNRVESKECGEKDEEDSDSAAVETSRDQHKKERRRKGKSNKRKRLRKKKKRRRKKKMKFDSNPDCQYEKGDWSECDLRTGLQTQVQTLETDSDSNSTAACEQTVVSTRSCITVPDEEMEDKKRNKKSRRKQKKDRGERKRQRKKNKKKGKKDKKRNKKKKDKEEVSKEPPRLTEFHVVPYTTFAVVTWQPPQPDDQGQHTPVDKYQIGFGAGYPDLHTVQVNGTEVTYKIENLEPGRQYIVSIRAENRLGVGQALYQTIMTRDAGGASSSVILPPIGVRATVLSSEAVNVSWVDMSGKGDPESRKRDYHLRYRQLNHLSTSSLHEYRFKMLRTSNTFFVVNGLQPFTKYEFAVMTSDGERNSTWSMMVWNMTQEAAPSTTPEDLTVILDPDSPGQIILSWQPPAKANGIITGYVVSYSTLTMEGQPLVEAVAGNKLSVTLTSLIPGLTYDFSVRAKNSKGVGPPLYIKDYLLPGDPAPVPATLRASPTVNDPTAVTLSWEISEEVTTNILGFVILYTSDMDSEHIHWEVESRIGKDLKMAIIDDLQPGTKYYFKIQAHTSVGYGPESNTVLFDTPDEDDVKLVPIEPPKKLQVNVLSSTSAVLSWQDPGMAQIFKEDVVLPVSSDSYTVRYRALDPEPSDYMIVSAPFTTLYLEDLLPLMRYEFSARVHRGRQHSDWSSTVENTTFAADFSQYPLKAEVKGQKQSPQVAILSWQPHSDSKIKEYVVMYSSDRRKPHKQWIQKAAVNQDVKQQVFYNLKPETTYFFFIQAMTDLGFGPRSKVVSYTTPKEDKASPNLMRPENLQVIVMSANSAVVSWHDPDLSKGKEKETEKPSVPSTYTLRYRDLGEKSLGYKFASPTFPSIFMVALQPATQYEFSVRVNSGDHHSEWSDPVVNTTFEAAPSSPPLNLSVTMDSGDPTTALLTWKPPESPNGEITGYLVFYETGKESGSSTVTGGELSHRVPFLKSQTTYFFRVGAKNSKGFSPLSIRVAYRTPRVIGTPPTDVTVVPSTDDPYNAIISWQPPNPSKRRIKHYTVTHYTEEGKHRTVQTVTGSTLTTVVKKLLPSTTYHFTVQAHYRRGGGPHSDVVKYSIPKELLKIMDRVMLFF